VEVDKDPFRTVETLMEWKKKEVRWLTLTGVIHFGSANDCLYYVFEM
jgi:hypothetical protein